MLFIMIRARLISIAFVILYTIFSNVIAYASGPIDVYSELPRTNAVQISPDGSKIAMVSPYKGKTGVFIYNLANPNAGPIVIPAPKSSLVKGVRWGSDDHVLTQGQSRHFYPYGKLRRHSVLHYRWYSTNINTGKTKMMMDDKIADESKLYQVVSGGNIHDLMRQDKDNILMSFREYTNRPVVRYFKVSLKTGNASLLETLPWDTERVIRSKETGKIIARSETLDNGTVRIYAGTYPEDKQIYTEKFDKNGTDGAYLLTVSNGKIIIAVDKFNKYDFFSIDPNTGTKSPFNINASIPSGYEYNHLFDPHTRELIGVTYTSDLPTYIYTSEPFIGWHRKLQKVLKGKTSSLISWTKDRSMVIAYAEGDGNAGEYYLFEPQAGQLSSLGGTYPELKSSQIGRTIRKDFTARDGLRIPAYLTLPPGKSESSGPMPLVILPHGGPIARDDASFDFWAQHIATQGYAVFKPQFRGSTGFTYRHQQKGNGQFGEGMLNDSIDGVNYLIDQGIADKNKICVTGASYGGYQALALPMIEPDMFKCALSLNGVSDLPKMLDYVAARTGDRESSSIKFWHRIMGFEFGGYDRLNTHSPAQNAEKIKAEVILMHGEDDGTVPIEQTKIMADALKKVGQSGDIIMLKDDDHNLSLPQSRKKLLEVSEELFARHLK